MLYNKPSVYAHAISGVLLMLSVIYAAFYFSKLGTRDPYQILILILLVCIALGVHGISHIGLEALYDYNPYFIIKEETIEPWGYKRLSV